MASVAVAIRGGGSRGSRRAMRWAVQNLLPQADRFILLHVMPSITSIPTPSGTQIPIKDMDAKVVAVYVQELRIKISEEMIVSFKKICKPGKAETLVLEDDDTATALIRYISEFNIRSLVMGSCSTGILSQLFKKPSCPALPLMVLKHAPDSCDIYVISRFRVITNWADPFANLEETTLMPQMTQRESIKVSRSKDKQIPGFHSSPVDYNVQKAFQASSTSEIGSAACQALTHKGFQISAKVDEGINDKILGGSGLGTSTIKQCNSNAYANAVLAEIEKVQVELPKTIAMYERACEELVLAQYKVKVLSSKCQEEATRVNVAQKNKETLRKIAAQEKEKYLEAMLDVDLAKSLLAKEACERQKAELIVLKESSEKQKIADALFLSDRTYRMYRRSEIEVATGFFSESNIIGEGAYGKVYRCNIDGTPVALKVLHPDSYDKKEEFLREVDVLSRLRHPNVVLLLGACPEIGCLVYEYMENGSLEECILQLNQEPPLPWSARFRIIFEVACGLAFLHNSKPEPIVHRDLKPGNILLDKNYVSKIGDVGLAKLILDVTPDNVTEYRDSILAGTLCYMDPEYHRTGTLRPKSDLYAFGVIILQLLTARHPSKLIPVVENAVATGFLADVLDQSVTDWPLAEAEELAHVALKCSKLRCRHRPDLELEVMPVLKRLADMANASKTIKRDDIRARSQYFCPILQEIMDDPQIAADGFSYENGAIQAWLGRHNISPVTKRRLEHTMLTPNHTLRSAIQEWRSCTTFSSS